MSKLACVMSNVTGQNVVLLFDIYNPRLMIPSDLLQMTIVSLYSISRSLNIILLGRNVKPVNMFCGPKNRFLGEVARAREYKWGTGQSRAKLWLLFVMIRGP